MGEQRSWPACRDSHTGKIAAGTPVSDTYFDEAGDFVLREIPKDATPYPEHMPVGTVVVLSRFSAELKEVLSPWIWQDNYGWRCMMQAVGDTPYTSDKSTYYEPIPQTKTITVSGPPEIVKKIKKNATKRGCKVDE